MAINFDGVRDGKHFSARLDNTAFLEKPAAETDSSHKRENPWLGQLHSKRQLT